jgi:hypothetical protein
MCFIYYLGCYQIIVKGKKEYFKFSLKENHLTYKWIFGSTEVWTEVPTWAMTPDLYYISLCLDQISYFCLR